MTSFTTSLSQNELITLRCIIAGNRGGGQNLIQNQSVDGVYYQKKKNLTWK